MRERKPRCDLFSAIVSADKIVICGQRLNAIEFCGVNFGVA